MNLSEYIHTLNVRYNKIVFKKMPEDKQPLSNLTTDFPTDCF